MKKIMFITEKKKWSQDIDFRNPCLQCNKHHVESTIMSAINSKNCSELEILEYKINVVQLNSLNRIYKKTYLIIPHGLINQQANLKHYMFLLVSYPSFFCCLIKVYFAKVQIYIEKRQGFLFKDILQVLSNDDVKRDMTLHVTNHPSSYQNWQNLVLAIFKNMQTLLGFDICKA